MARPALELADIFRQYGPQYRSRHRGSLSYQQLAVMHAVEVCRTAALGGHIEECDAACGHQRISYNSCRNRHCNKCQSVAKAEWLQRRQADLLPVEYFHVVFSLPAQLAAIAYQNKQVVYGILFRAVSETLRSIAADPKRLGAEIGVLAVLHTWGQTLEFHPHVHCVVPGGGLSPNGRWIGCRRGFFLPVRVLSCRFRRLFLQYLNAAFRAGELQFFGGLQPLSQSAAWNCYLRTVPRKWVVYAKPPFGGPQQVLEYLARYTHRVAISNNRLLRLEDGKVSFGWKDYRDHGRQKVMTLEVDEFIRRFLMHVLPKGFQRIRQYGLLSNRSRVTKLARCRELLAAALPVVPAPTFTGDEWQRCPVCSQGRMRRIRELPPLPVEEYARAAGIDSS